MTGEATAAISASTGSAVLATTAGIACDNGKK